jgi:hypothetical protein
MKIVLLLVAIITLLIFAWFAGTKCVYTVTTLVPPEGRPFVQLEDGSYSQCAETAVTTKHTTWPWSKKDKTYFDLFGAFTEETGYKFPGGEFMIHDTITLKDGQNVEGK